MTNPVHLLRTRKRYLLYSFQRRYALAFIACGAAITAAIVFLTYHLTSSSPDGAGALESNVLKWLFAGAALFVLVANGAFYVLIVQASHRLAGPIAVMSRYVSELSAGKLPSIRPLRKHDELKDVFSRFADMVDGLRRECENEAKILEDAIAALSATSGDRRDRATVQLTSMLRLRQERVAPFVEPKNEPARARAVNS